MAHQWYGLWFLVQTKRRDENQFRWSENIFSLLSWRGKSDERKFEWRCQLIELNRSHQQTANELKIDWSEVDKRVKWKCVSSTVQQRASEKLFRFFVSRRAMGSDISYIFFISNCFLCQQHINESFLFIQSILQMMMWAFFVCCCSFYFPSFLFHSPAFPLHFEPTTMPTVDAWNMKRHNDNSRQYAGERVMRKPILLYYALK